MNLDLNLKSLSAREPKKEFTITVNSASWDAANAILQVLTQMKKDCDYGHGSVYIMDAEGDDKAETYIDGDGGNSIGSITVSTNGAEPVEVTYHAMKDKTFKLE